MSFGIENPKYELKVDGDVWVIKPQLPDYVRTRLVEVFGEQNLGVNGRPLESILDASGLNPSRRIDLADDLRFYITHPHIPVENLCARLNNFYPRNASQEEALDWAQRLIDYSGSRAAGVYTFGESGTGKTHLAVGVAKELARGGRLAHFINQHNALHYDGLLKWEGESQEVADQFWIVDDLNSPYGTMASIYRQLVYVLHDHSGKIMVTANIGYDELQQKVLVGAGEDRQRFDDRVKNLFRVIHMFGQSRRSESAWFQPQ